MENEIRKYVYDIKEAVDSIDNYLGQKRDYTVYSSNKMLRRAIEREFEIIGEAMNSISKSFPQIEISSQRQIINMRNREFMVMTKSTMKLYGVQ